MACHSALRERPSCLCVSAGAAGGGGLEVGQRLGERRGQPRNFEVLMQRLEGIVKVNLIAVGRIVGKRAVRSQGTVLFGKCREISESCMCILTVASVRTVG